MILSVPTIQQHLAKIDDCPPFHSLARARKRGGEEDDPFSFAVDVRDEQ